MVERMKNRQLGWISPRLCFAVVLVAAALVQRTTTAPVVQSDTQAMEADVRVPVGSPIEVPAQRLPHDDLDDTAGGLLHNTLTPELQKFYLSQFGYLDGSFKNPSSGALISEDAMKTAISEFQAFAGLNVTGDLDDETRELMSTPRCGVKDKVGIGHNARRKRYALQGSRWRVRELTYKISKYPRGLSQEEVDREVAKSFQVWSEHTKLNFIRKKSGQVHIEIRFERGEHGDGDPFDGPGGTLAHAYFPVYGGDAHFDDSESWTVRSRRGTNLFQVAAHEFGHSLGLSHSDVKSALMAPFYRGYNPTFNLDNDDIIAIQELYGKKDPSGTKGGGTPGSGGGGKKPEPEEPPTGEDVELCTDATIDTMFNSAEGATYAFKGDHYWKLSEQGIHRGYPRPISSSWPGLPGNIDAAFTYKNGKTYFFKGSKYWRYTGKRMDDNYPMDISEGFTGIPDNVDAAMVWGGNGKIYFFKGSKFWRFDPSQRPPVKSTYPKPIGNWEGVPDNLDAALQYTNGYTYFFKDGLYYRFSDSMFMVDPADPPFPRPAGYWWFGCRSASKGQFGNDPSLRKNGDDDMTKGVGNSAENNGTLIVEHSKPTLNSQRNSDVDDTILDAGITGEGVGKRDSRDRVGSNGAAHVTNFYHTTLNMLAALAALRFILPRP